MHTRDRAILATRLKKIGFKQKGHNLYHQKGQVKFGVQLQRYHKIVAVARGAFDTTLHTSSPGVTERTIRLWLSLIKSKKSYGGN